MTGGDVFYGHFTKSETVLGNEYFTAFHIYMLNLTLTKGHQEEFSIFKLCMFEL